MSDNLDLTVHPDTFEQPLPTDTSPLPEPLPIKKYVKFHKDSDIQIETRTAFEMPTDNTEDGSTWHEVDEHFPDGKHLIYNDGAPRAMTDAEHKEWQDAMDLSGALLHVRNHRSVILPQTDWTQMPNNNLTDEQKAEWETYRQALRDLPESVTGPAHSVEFPVPPQG